VDGRAHGSGVYANLVNVANNITNVTATNLSLPTFPRPMRWITCWLASYPGISVTSSVATLTVLGPPPPIDLSFQYSAAH